MITTINKKKYYSYICDNNIETVADGKKIYNTNKFFKTLANIMENPEFVYMFNNYFNTWDNIELFVMFAKVYHSFTQHYPNMSKYEKIAMVKLIVDTSKTRQLVCKEIMDFRKNKLIK